MDVERFRIDFAGGSVEGVRAGDSGAPALVFHNGTPSAAALLPDVVHAAARHGFQVLTWSRPGHAGSTARPGRTVADNVEEFGLAATGRDTLKDVDASMLAESLGELASEVDQQAANVPTAITHLLPRDGHITVGARRIGEILDDHVALGRP